MGVCISTRKVQLIEKLLFFKLSYVSICTVIHFFKGIELRKIKLQRICLFPVECHEKLKHHPHSHSPWNKEKSSKDNLILWRRIAHANERMNVYENFAQKWDWFMIFGSFFLCSYCCLCQLHHTILGGAGLPPQDYGAAESTPDMAAHEPGVSHHTFHRRRCRPWRSCVNYVATLTTLSCLCHT